MKYQVQTVIDITQTDARRINEGLAYKQQLNFSSIIQTIGLRSNLEYVNPPRMEHVGIGRMGFGENYKGRQNVWTFLFDIPYGGKIEISTLDKDFDLIPVITGLKETVELPEPVFRSFGEEKNIIFTFID